jgi:hypothetical protein
VVALLTQGKDPNFPRNYFRLAYYPQWANFLKIIKRHIEGRNLLNASQFGFHECPSTTLQNMRLADHVTLNFSNKMSTAAVFLDIEKAFDTTWHHGLLYK